jgi:hypothetical protein
VFDTTSSQAPTSTSSGSSSSSVECLEPWLAWIRRVTSSVEQHMAKLKLDDWVEQQRRRKSAWACHGARRTDGHWSTGVLSWVPAEKSERNQARPYKRWTDDLELFANDYF